MKRTILLVYTTLFIVSASFSQSISPSPANISSDKAHSTSRGAFNYILTTYSEEYHYLTGATSINNGEIWDEATYIVPLAFPFDLNGHPITQLQFYGSGAKLRSATSDPDVFALLFPLETDLVDRGAFGNVSLSPLSYKVDGAPGSRIQKIEWRNAGSYYEMVDDGTLNMYINLQLWLYEGSNIIEFRYGDSDIDDPERFYEGNLFVGLADLNEPLDDFVNPHFFAGLPYNPYLSLFEQLLEGTPEYETVYKLSLNVPVTIELSGSNNTSFCNPNGIVNVVAAGGASPYSYVWNTNDTNDTITNLAAGTYIVTVTDAAGTSVIDSITITGPDSLSANLTSTPETYNNAENGTASSSPNGGTPPYTFSWNTGSNASMISGLAPGAYMVTITDKNGCSTIDTIDVLAFICDTLHIEAAAINASCFLACNGSITINNIINGAAPYAYLWSNGDTTSIVSDLCTDFYQVTISDAEGCMVSDAYLISEPNELFANTGSTNETAMGLHDGTAWASPFGGIPPYTYLWDNGSIDSLITNLSQGMYTVTVTDTNGCVDIETIMVLPFPCAGLIEQSLIPITCYGACDGSATVMVIGGLGNETYLWNTGDTTNAIHNLCPGNYTVTVMNMFNCTYATSFTVEQPDSILVVIDSIVHVTDTTPGAIFISVLGGTPEFQYSWYGPDGFFNFGQDIINLEAGHYYMVVGDHSGCVTTLDTIEILDLTVGISGPDIIDVRIFPNPSNDKVHIDIEDISDFRINLRSFDGRNVYTWFEEKMLNVKSLPSGLYLIEGISGNKIFRERLLIQR